MIAARRSRTVQRLAGTWRRCAAGRAQQAAATTTAAKMAMALALLNVRTAVIAARDGGGGESKAVRGVAVAAVSGARRVAHLGRRVATRRAAARERQHTSGSMPNARRAMTRRPAAHRAAECLAAAAVAVVRGTAYSVEV